MDGAHTIGGWTRDRALLTPERIAVDDGTTTLTYRELDRRATRLAGWLRRTGHRAGDRIATLTGNSAEHVVVFFACAKARLVLVPLSWRLSARELAAQLSHAEPGLLLVEPAFAELATAALDRLDQPPPVLPIDLSPDGTAELAPVRDDDPLLLLYTSGTTGLPKGVSLSHANCFWTNLGLSRAIPIEADDVVLAVLPQFHVGGWNVQPLLAWWVGATVLLARTFDPGTVLSLIEGRRVRTMMGVPANYLFLAEHPAFGDTDLSGLRTAVVGGAALPESLARTWQARGVGLVPGYGLSEAGPNVLCLPAEQAVDRPGFAGRPYPYVEVAVADPASGEIMTGVAEGELLVRGPNVFAGYWRDPAATARALRSGWLHTGDLVHRDADGYHRILDRTDDMFVSGGENIAPSEVENVLHGHPSVAEAAVVGRPDSRWGQVGVAFVVCRPDQPTPSAGELLAYCRAELAGFKVPRAVRFVDRLPRSAVGKLLRRDLRDTEGRCADGEEQGQ